MKEKIEYLIWSVFQELRSSGLDKNDCYDIFISLITWKYLSDRTVEAEGKDGGKWRYPDRIYFYDETMRAQDQNNLSDKIKVALKNWEMVNAQEFVDLLTLDEYNLKQMPESFWRRTNRFFEELIAGDVPENDISGVSVMSDMLSYLERLILQDEWGTTYYTPREVTELMADLVADHNSSSLYDPYCKAGDLLTVAEHRLNGIKRINGVAATNLQRKLAWLRLILSNENPKIEVSVMKDVQIQRQDFDIILSNPPFGSVYEERILSTLPQGKWISQLQPKSRIDTLYLCHSLDMLSEEGWAAIILPSIFLSGGGEFKKIREQILRENLLEAVITLPAGIFPQTGVSTVLLIFHKKRRHDQLIMYNASKEVKRVGKQLYLDDAVMKEFVHRYKKQDFVGADQVIQVKIDDIIANDYDLKFSSYQNNDDNFPGDLIPAETILTECLEIEKELAGIKERMDGLLKRIPNRTR